MHNRRKQLASMLGAFPGIPVVGRRQIALSSILQVRMKMFSSGECWNPHAPNTFTGFGMVAKCLSRIECMRVIAKALHIFWLHQCVLKFCFFLEMSSLIHPINAFSGGEGTLVGTFKKRFCLHDQNIPWNISTNWDHCSAVHK